MTSETPWGNNDLINMPPTEKKYANSVVNNDIGRAFDIFSRWNGWDSYLF